SPADPRSWLAAGAMVFALSDGLIAVRRTLLRGERARRLTEGVILTTYALAQVMIVEGILAVAHKK
ncbi:MAG: lysoplasmalogenase family protein, partial [Mycobacteriaceae bacterium]